MKIIQIPIAHFEALYHILTQYLYTSISADECIEEGLHYIGDKNLLSQPSEDALFDVGYRLIYRYSPEFNGFRSIYLSPNGDKLFYEGVISLRFLDELRYIDYVSFDKEDIKMLCKKYKLKPDEN